MSASFTLSTLLSLPAFADSPQQLSKRSQPQIIFNDTVKPHATVPNALEPSITIIIDDIGDNYRLGAKAVNLNGNVTCAFLPHTPHSKKLANLAHQQGKEVMLHLPMSSMYNLALGPGGLRSELTRGDFENTLDAAITSVPHAVGVNNHMGSLLTQQPLQMKWVMGALKKHQLFFIDSRTTKHSLAYQEAQNSNLATRSRDVFLDDNKSPAAIDRQFKHLIAIAKKTGTAIGIGHPYKETLRYLSHHLPNLNHYGVRLVSASKIIALKQQTLNKLATR